MEEIARELEDVDREINRLTMLQPLHIGEVPTDIEVNQLEDLYQRQGELHQLLSFIANP